MEGLNIRAIRKELLKWSLEKLARNLGVTLGTVWNWESGRSKPSPLAMEKIKKLFDEKFQGLGGQLRELDQTDENLLARIEKKDEGNWYLGQQQMLPLKMKNSNKGV